MISKGLEGIVANTTRLSDVLGDKGQLIYAGYDINELAGKVSFEEVIYLLWNERLPNRAELDALCAELRSHRELPAGKSSSFLQEAPKDANPMDVVRTAVSMLGLYDQSKGYDRASNYARCLSLTAKIGVITGYYHRARQGKSLPPVRTDLGSAAHFLYLLNGEEPTREAASTLDLAYVLHADHGMNASTFTARVVIATLTDVFSAVTAAIGALKGPLHGGANEGVIHMLREIGDEDKVDAWVEEQLAQKKKIMGIGHRVYKTLDPRAPHLRAHGGEADRAARRAEVGAHERAHRHADEGAQGPQRERRFLFGHGVLLAGPADGPVHADLRHRAHGGLDRAHPGAAFRQPALPSAERVHRHARSG